MKKVEGRRRRYKGGEERGGCGTERVHEDEVDGLCRVRNRNDRIVVQRWEIPTTSNGIIRQMPPNRIGEGGGGGGGGGTGRMFWGGGGV